MKQLLKYGTLGAISIMNAQAAIVASADFDNAASGMTLTGTTLVTGFDTSGQGAPRDYTPATGTTAALNVSNRIDGVTLTGDLTASVALDGNSTFSIWGMTWSSTGARTITLADSAGTDLLNFGWDPGATTFFTNGVALSLSVISYASTEWFQFDVTLNATDWDLTITQYEEGTANLPLFVNVETFSGQAYTTTGLDFDKFSITSSSTSNGFVDNIVVNAVPEPTSSALLALGGIALILRRRK